jgi:hypothetical protein
MQTAPAMPLLGRHKKHAPNAAALVVQAALNKRDSVIAQLDWRGENAHV